MPYWVCSDAGDGCEVMSLIRSSITIIAISILMILALNNIVKNYNGEKSDDDFKVIGATIQNSLSVRNDQVKIIR